jgi:hypothetical protein
VSLKNPSNFFEQEKEEESARKKLEEEKKLNNKNFAAPKEYFGEGEEVVEIIEEKTPKAEPNPLAEIREDIKQLSKSIPEKTDLSDVFGRIEELKERIDNIPGQISYEGHINVLRAEITEVEESIPEQFDPSDLYNNLSSLKENIERVRSEIPVVPEPVLYDDDLDAIKGLVEEVRKSIPKIPEVRYYEEELNLIIDSIEHVREEIPVIPEIKYYDDEISDIEKGIKLIEKSISKLPKVKYYDKQIKEILESVKEVREDIPEVPEVKYYDEEIKGLEEKISSVEDSIPTVPEVKYYDEDIKGINKEIRGLYKKYSSIRIPDQEQYISEAKNLYSSFEKKNQNLLKKINHLEEVFSKFNEEVLTEGLLNIPPNEDNSDPLTPLDKNYATLEDLQNQYKIFINRIQQQLATLGGGGIGDAPYDGQAYVRKDYKWVLSSSAGGGGAGLWQSDAVGINTTSNIGVGANAVAGKRLYVSGDAEFTGNVSVGGTLTYEDVKNVDSIGVITARQDVRVGQNLSVVGLTTLGSGNGIGTVHVGLGNTALYVDGDARVVGVLTVGRGSVTIDGENNTVTTGIVTITNAQVYIGENVTIEAGASGINSAPNVLYVAKDGLDTNNGTSIDNAKLTISAAVGIAEAGTTIKVLSGNYTENNPIEIPAFVSIVGDDQRSVTVAPNNNTSDIFHVRKGNKLANMTFVGHLSPAAAVAFPTGDDIAENVNGGAWKGPYVQNCTSNTTTGTGIYIDGNQARSLKAMNVDSFTQYNQGGVGVAVTNEGFAQLVSVFTICCDEAISCHEGGQADLANSNCSFGTKGLVAKGVGPTQYTGIVTATGAVSQDQVALTVTAPTLSINNFVYDNVSGLATVTTTANHNFQVGMGVTVSGIEVTCPYGSKTYPYQKPYVFEIESIPSVRKFVINVGVSTVSHTYASGGTAKIDIDRPYDGQVIYFDQLYNSVQTIAVGSGGTGYSQTPSVTVDNPTGPNGQTATAFATLEGDSVSSISIISSGSQYVGTPNVTISAPQSGSNTATATANMSPIYYTINTSTPVSSGISTVTLDENLLNTVGVGTTAYFAQSSRIVASSHTFEYVGSGNEIINATPKRGGVTNQANEVVTLDGGKVIYTSTDQSGNFKIGDGLQINQNTGTISGRSFTKSLFTEMTPFILALS